MMPIQLDLPIPGFSPEGYRMSRSTCVKNCPLFCDMLKNSRHAFSRDATSFFPAASVVVHQSILTNLHRYFYCRYNGSLITISNSASVEQIGVNEVCLGVIYR